MRFSLNFINEFIKVDLPPAELSAQLTMSGMEVEHFEKIGDDWVFDIEVTSNRYDWLSMLGIAREISACLHKKLKITYPKIAKKPLLSGRNIVIENNQDCCFYVGRSIRGIKVKEAPRELIQRVLNCGLNSVNNVVDITNYCMLKWGNPLHAFDEDKLEGDIYIRRAKPGEQFIGIDSKERILQKENLVIADEKKVIALAGVMGAKNTEVDHNTKNVFLEAAIFSPITVRRSRRAAGLDTDSSYRFERKVFADYLEFASSESSKLIEQFAGGSFCGYKEAGKKPKLEKKDIGINLRHLNSYLGDEFAENKIKNILESLGFKVTAPSKNKITVSVPAFRLDIEREVDVYEEFIRIYGYEKIKPKIPFLIPQRTENSLYTFKNKLKGFISQLGLREIITYSIEAEQELVSLGEENLIKLINPLREQENTLRPTLLLGMLKSMQYNVNRGQDDLRFFEIANTYFKKAEDFCEAPKVSLAVMGEHQNFFYLKKCVEEILMHLNIKNFNFDEMQGRNFTNALKITANGADLGFLGKLDTAVAEKFDLKEDLFFAELDITSLQNNEKNKEYQPFSQYPKVFRDISMVLDKSIKFKEIEQIIKEKGRNIADLCIVDIYKGKELSNKQSAFTLRVYYQSPAKTLTSTEVDGIHNTIRHVLSTKAGIILR